MANKMESDEEPKLQKLGQERATKKRRTCLELPELNTTLVKVYHELARVTHVAKDMVVTSKEACKQALKHRMAALEAQL